jgi:uncharacterized protein (DUF433 family)
MYRSFQNFLLQQTACGYTLGYNTIQLKRHVAARELGALRVSRPESGALVACYARRRWRAKVASVQGVIVKDPEILGGIAVFRGTRVPFKNLVDYLEGGHSLDEFLRQFPTVTREMAVQALEEAKDSLLARIA